MLGHHTVTSVFWIVIVFLALDFGMDIFILIESRKTVREAEHEVATAQKIKEDVKAMYDTIMEVINGEEAGPETGGTESRPVAPGAHSDPRLNAVTDELPRVVEP